MVRNMLCKIKFSIFIIVEGKHLKNQKSRYGGVGNILALEARDREFESLYLDKL